MSKTLAQAVLSATMARSGMTDAELAAALGVHQSTISRLKHGRITKTAGYQRKLDVLLRDVAQDPTDELYELVAMAQNSPALRKALLALKRLLRESA